jgi:hypothetical protein
LGRAQNKVTADAEVEGNMRAPGDVKIGGESEGPMQVGGTHHKIQEPALSRTGAGVPNLGFNNKSSKHPTPPQTVDLLGGVIEISDKNSFEAQTPFKK